MDLSHDRPSRAEVRGSTLRGAAPVSVAPHRWINLGAVVIILFAFAVAVSFVSALHDHARVQRLTTHGIAVTAIVGECIGNLGGSGSNASSYTCHATYSVGTTSYHEVVGAMSQFAPPGTRVSVVADPSQPSTIELASAVAHSSASPSVYVVPAVLSVLLGLLLVAYTRLIRRARASTVH